MRSALACTKSPIVNASAPVSDGLLAAEPSESVETTSGEDPAYRGACHRGRSVLLAMLVVTAAWLLSGGPVTAAVPGRIAALRETTNCGTAKCADIYVMNADGSHQARLTKNGRIDPLDAIQPPSWSPNGRKLAFFGRIPCSISTGDTCHEIFVMNADGSGQRQLTKNLSELYRQRPAWSPDGRRIAFVGNVLDSHGEKTGACPCDVFVVNVDGSGLRQLAANSIDPVWSPSGKKIAFASDRHGGVAIDGEIYVMNADGSDQKNLSDDRAHDSNPVWSPDGRKILFTSQPSGGGVGKFGVFAMNATGSGRKQLARGAGFNVMGWSPDGKKVVIGANGGAPIIVVNADGSSIKQLRSFADSPAWAPGGKKIGFIRRGKIYVVNADGSGQKRLTPNYRTDDALAWQPVP